MFSARITINDWCFAFISNNTNKDTANRLIDFLGGVSYITGGEIRRIGETTYVLAPYNVDISGEFIDEISNISGEDIFDEIG